MSFDPFGSESPSPSERPAYSREYPGEVASTPLSAVRGKIMPAAISLLIIGVLNLLCSLYFPGNSIILYYMPDARLEKMQVDQLTRMKQMFPNMQEAIDEQMESIDANSMRRQALYLAIASGVFISLPALLTCLAGIQMLRLRSFSLCVFASLVSAVPCVSPTGCCCLGQIVGIWSLIVLLDESVRMSFR